MKNQMHKVFCLKVVLHLHEKKKQTNLPLVEMEAGRKATKDKSKNWFNKENLAMFYTKSI